MARHKLAARDGWRIGQSTVKAKPGFGPRLLLVPALGDRIVRKRMERLHDCQPLKTHAPRYLLRYRSASRFKCPRVRLLHDARPCESGFSLCIPVSEAGRASGSCRK